MQKFTINKQKNLFEFEDGSTAPINAQDIDEARGNVAGKNPKGLAIKEATKERLREQKKRTSLGSGVLNSIDTAFEHAQSNIATAPADYLMAIAEAYKNEDKSERSFLNRVHENYTPRREGRKEFKEELLANEPVASYIGKGLGLAGEVAATAGLPGAVAAPLLGFAESQTSILDPGKVALEAVTDAALGKAFDWGVGKLSNLAGRRGARQAEKAGIAQVESQNALRTEATSKLNSQEAKRFAQESAVREAQMAGLPAKQAASQQAFSQGVTQNVGKIGDTLGSAKVSDAALGIEDFIVNNIDRSALAGTPEANKVSKFLQTVFNSKGKGVDKSHLNQAFNAIEGRIAQAEGAEKQLLLDFKNQITGNLSQAIPEAAIYHKFGEPMAREVIGNTEKFIKNTISKNSPEVLAELSAHFKQDFAKGLEDSVRNDVQSIFQKFSGNFSEAVENGILANELQQVLANNPLIQTVKNNPESFLNKKVINDLKKLKIPLESTELYQGYRNLIQNLDDLPKLALRNLEENLKKNSNKIARDKVFQTEAMNRILPGIQGAAQPILPPIPVRPAINAQPNLQQVPQLSQAQGPAQTFANFLEDSTTMQKLSKVKDFFGGAGGASAAGAVAKMAGLPIAKTAAGAGIASVGADLLTRNSPGGQQARTALKQGLLQSYLTTKAMVFPSFREGILDDPNDRRMFSRQIEDDPSLSLEDKAMMQTKVNRGQSL